MQEVIRLRQAQQTANDEIQSLSDRLDATDHRQQQMIAFFAQALKHPALIQHFVSSSGSIKRIEDGRRRKKRRGSAAVVSADDQSDSEGSDSGNTDPTGTETAALVVHNPSSQQQSLADLAEAFMQMLNTEPPKRSQVPRRSTPLIEEPPAASAFNSGRKYSSLEEGAIPMNDFAHNNDHDDIDNDSLIQVSSKPIGSSGFVPSSLLYDQQQPNAAILGTDLRGHQDTRSSPIIELPLMPSLNMDDIDLDKLPDILSMPSQDLLITDNDLAKLNEHWNSEMHVPQGQSLSVSLQGGNNQKESRE